MNTVDWIILILLSIGLIMGFVRGVYQTGIQSGRGHSGYNMRRHAIYAGGRFFEKHPENDP